MIKKAYTEKKIKEFNKFFNSLTPEQKRIEIAKDVIVNLKSQIIIPQTGTYLGYNNRPKNIELTESLQKHLPLIQCEVCAVGSLLISNVKYNNNFNIGDYSNISKIADTLLEFFDKKQLILIECAYEGFGWNEMGDEAIELDNGLFADEGEDISMYDITTSEIDAANEFYHNYDDTNIRLISIMQNIIDNNGEFKPEKLKIENEK